METWKVTIKIMKDPNAELEKDENVERTERVWREEKMFPEMEAWV